MNMGYCRFQNTLRDLEDVYEHMEDVLSTDEHEAREEIIRICTAISREIKANLYELRCEDDEELDEEDENEEDE